MIYKLELVKSEQKVSWRWYWRKSFKPLSRWHTSVDMFDFCGGICDAKSFDWTQFSFTSSRFMTTYYLYSIYLQVELAQTGVYPEFCIAHVAKDGTCFLEFDK